MMLMLMIEWNVEAKNEIHKCISMLASSPNHNRSCFTQLNFSKNLNGSGSDGGKTLSRQTIKPIIFFFCRHSHRHPFSFSFTLEKKTCDFFLNWKQKIRIKQIKIEKKEKKTWWSKKKKWSSDSFLLFFFFRNQPLYSHTHPEKKTLNFPTSTLTAHTTTKIETENIRLDQNHLPEIKFQLFRQKKIQKFHHHHHHQNIKFQFF